MHYAELLCLTNFSFQLGASHPRELVERAKELGYGALAIADECSLAGIVRAHEAAETAGLPLIIGSQFRFEEGDRVALLAPTQAAYSQICELITRARRAAAKGTYSIGRADFENGAISETIALWVRLSSRPTWRMLITSSRTAPKGWMRCWLAASSFLCLL